MLCVSSLKLYRTIVKDSKNTSVKGEVIRHTALCCVLVVPLLVAACVEAFFSSNLICL